MEITDNMLWWILQHLRFCYRRKAVIETRHLDNCARLEWLGVEEFVVSRIDFHLDIRISKLQSVFEKLAKKKQTASQTSRLKKQIGNGKTHQAYLSTKLEVINQRKYDNNNENITTVSEAERLEAEDEETNQALAIARINKRQNSKNTSFNEININKIHQIAEQNSAEINTNDSGNEQDSSSLELIWLEKLKEYTIQLRCDIDAKQETILREEGVLLRADRKVRNRRIQCCSNSVLVIFSL